MVYFFFNDPATTEIYTLSLHDALPISTSSRHARRCRPDLDEPCSLPRTPLTLQRFVRPPRRRVSSSTRSAAPSDARLMIFMLALGITTLCLPPREWRSKLSQ